MNRALWFIICTLVGLELIAWGLLAPVHIGAIDAQALEVSGASGPSLVQEGLNLVQREKVGPARMILKAAEGARLRGRDKLVAAIRQYEDAQPRARLWGGSALYLDLVYEKQAPTTNLQDQPFFNVLASPRARDTLMESLRRSRRPSVVEVLRTRQLTNTVLLPPALSSAGQACDAAIATTALLMQQDHFTSGLRKGIEAAVATALSKREVQPLELIYLDMLSLGKRLDWVQLVELVKQLPDTKSLTEAADLLRENEGQAPVVYSAMYFAESPAPVAKYLERYPGRGLKDLSFALGAGPAAARNLLERQKPVHYPTWRERIVRFGPVRVLYEPLARISADQPGLGFFVKYALCLLGALLLGRAASYLSPALVDEIVDTKPLVTGPQVAIGLCFLFAVLFFSETLVTRAAPAGPPPFRLKFPMASVVPRATVSKQPRPMTDKTPEAVSLLIFFIAQASIYVVCRMKLAQIRRESMPSRLKLRLLENEEHLFDAGLYFGFVGTVVSLILVSMQVTKMGLMSAYSSTSFGIIFVSILKICHVRPYRRRLILDAELAEQEAQVA